MSHGPLGRPAIARRRVGSLQLLARLQRGEGVWEDTGVDAVEQHGSETEADAQKTQQTGRPHCKQTQSSFISDATLNPGLFPKAK